MTHANVIQVSNAFATSKINREGVLKNLSKLANECSRKCEKCPLPQVVKTSFREPIVVYLRANLACLRPSQ